MSNTRKIIAKRKKRRENGRRALFLGSKPHSKGESFSRLGVVRAEIERVKMMRARGIVRAAREVVMGRSMGLLMWGGAGGRRGWLSLMAKKKCGEKI